MKAAGIQWRHMLEKTLSLLAIAETLRYELVWSGLVWSEDEGWPVMAPSHALPSDRLVGQRGLIALHERLPQGACEG